MASLAKRCVAELAGTALLVYFGAGAAAITLMIAAGTDPATPFNIGIGQLGGLGDWFAIGMVFAIVIAAVIYSMGRISGAHINPAVTIALFATKRFPANETGAYVVVQLIGAAIGSLLFAATAGMDAVTIGGLGATVPFPGIGYGQAILAETIGTFVLMLVIMGSADDWTPSAPCEEVTKIVASRGEPMTMVLYPDTFHDFDNPALTTKRVRRDVHNGVKPDQGVTVAPNPLAREDAKQRVADFIAAIARSPAAQLPEPDQAVVRGQSEQPGIAR